MNTRELIENWPFLQAEHRANLLLAVSTRGRWKGFMLASAPAQSTGDKWAAWQALVLEVAPVRASMWGMMTSSHRDRVQELSRVVERSGLGAALRAVEPPMRWSLWAMNHDRDAVLTEVGRVCKAGNASGWLADGRP